MQTVATVFDIVCSCDHLWWNMTGGIEVTSFLGVKF